MLQALFGVIIFVVTLTSVKEVRAYPCRTREKALELANRFIAGLSRRSPEAEADILEGATPAPRAALSRIVHRHYPLPSGRG